MSVGLAILAMILTAPTAHAHLTLLDPMARTSDPGLTESPCGGIPAGDPVKAYTPGSAIDISVSLVVDHGNPLHAYITDDGFATKIELASKYTSGPGTYEMNGVLPASFSGPAVIQVTDGTYVSCADVTLSDHAPFAINAGITDAWYFPETNGQGFLIAVFPDIKQAFLAWFTFDTERPPEDTPALLGEPGHRWLTAQGPYDGNLAQLDIVITKGGVFDSGEPSPQNSDPGTVGTIELEFNDCFTGVVRYTMPGLGLEGEVPIQRIVNDNVALCEALQTPKP